MVTSKPASSEHVSEYRDGDLDEMCIPLTAESANVVAKAPQTCTRQEHANALDVRSPFRELAPQRAQDTCKGPVPLVVAFLGPVADYVFECLGHGDPLRLPPFGLPVAHVFLQLLARNVVECQRGLHDIVTHVLVVGQLLLDVPELGRVVEVFLEKLRMRRDHWSAHWCQLRIAGAEGEEHHLFLRRRHVLV